MPKFEIHAHVRATAYLGVFTAATKEEAEAMAWKAAYVQACHQCSDSFGDPEIDGMDVEELEEGAADA